MTVSSPFSATASWSMTTGSDEPDFSHLTCPYVTPGSGADKDKVAADEATKEDMPENREKLKRYIIGMEKHMLEQLMALAIGHIKAGRLECMRSLVSGGGVDTG